MLYLYRYLDKNDVPLYIGVTSQPFKRLTEHKNKMFRWTDSIATIRIKRFKSMQSARKAEGLAIKNESPLYNVVQNPNGRRTSKRRVVDTANRVVDKNSYYYKNCAAFAKNRELIKSLHNIGTSVKRIAAKYGITHQRVYQIVNGK